MRRGTAILLGLLLTTAPALADDETPTAPKPVPAKTTSTRTAPTKTAPTKTAPNNAATEKEPLSPVVAKGAVFERVATGFRFTEGPAAAPDGTLYFTDIPNERIHRFDPKTRATSVFRETSGRANGLLVAPDGALLACEGGRRQVVRITKAGVTVLASSWNGKRLNSPNDLALDAHGGIWFTDPRYGRRQDDREIDIEAVYYRDPTGAVHQRITDVKKPNGILLSRDGRTLYVAASTGQAVVAYPVLEPGVVGPQRPFASLDTAKRGGPDGMALDERGNVYCAGQGHIWVWSPAGKRLAHLAVPEGPSNCTFGGANRRTLYVTARTSLYRMPMQVAGAAPVPTAKRSAKAAAPKGPKNPR